MIQASTEHALEHAAQHCSTRGVRLTRKRRLVLAGLIESSKALSAYELVDYCRDALGAELLPMSVYRILDFLEQEHLVHRLDLARRYVACSHIGCDHAHEAPQFLICRECNRVEELGLSGQLVDAIAQSVETAGFQLDSRQIELDCVCKPCASRRRSET